MSIYGSQVLSEIEAAHSRAASQAKSDSGILEDLQNQHASANAQLREAYEKLMQVRTQDPRAKREGLAEVDAWLREAATKRERDYQAILVQLTQAKALAAQFDQAHASHTKIQQAAKQAWAAARLSTVEDLSATDPDFIKAQQRVADAVRRSQAVDTHLEEITAATDAFVAQCKSDPLFEYCSSRRVGLADSAGNLLTRGLDRIVARVSGYYDNRKLLTDAQQDLERWIKHQALLHVELEDARARVEQAVDEALETQAGQDIYLALVDASAQLEKTSSSRKEAHANASQLQSQKQEFDREQDPQSRQMRDRLFAAISKASDKALRVAAAETASREDDEAAQVVALLRSKIPALSLEITRAKEKTEASAAQAKRLASLASGFSSRGYSGRYSRFDYGFDANSLITGVMLGQMSVNQAMGHASSSHRDVTPPPPPPPSYSSGSSSGGFSSGGGFGGGGGFSTGGGF